MSALPSWCCLPTEDYPLYLDLEEIPAPFGRSDVIQNYFTKTFEANIKATINNPIPKVRRSYLYPMPAKGFLDLEMRLFAICHWGISDEAWRGEQNGSKIRGFSGDVLNMDVELSGMLAARKETEKKVDGGGDTIEVHRRLEEDVDESGNEQNNVPDSNNVEKQESDNDATIAGETVGDVDQHAHETETMKGNLHILDEEEEQLLFGEDGGVEWISTA
eukprot:scaffold9913_cov36-Cyclotella_meneghiniana.AAC.2